MIATETRPDRSIEDAELGALMLRYREGDAVAFADLHHRLGGSLRAMFRRKGLPPDRVEDLVQETFLQVHRARHTCEPSRGVRPWVFGVARNVWLMDRRAARRRPVETTGTDGCAEPSSPPEAARVHDRSWVGEAVARVRPERRVPLLMRHVWGYSFKEIADTMGIRESAAKVRSHRAMGELRELLSAPTLRAA